MAFVLVSFVVLLSVFVTWEINSGPLGFDGLFYSKKNSDCVFNLLIDWLIDWWLIDRRGVSSLTPPCGPRDWTQVVRRGSKNLLWNLRFVFLQFSVSGSSVLEPDLHILCPQATGSPLMRLDLYLCEWITKQKNKHFPLQTSKQLFQHHVGTV